MARARVLVAASVLGLLLPLVLAQAIAVAEAYGPRWQMFNTTLPLVQQPLAKMPMAPWGCMGRCGGCMGGGWHWPRAGAWAVATQTTVTGTLLEVIPPKIMVLDVNGSKTYVVLPWMLATSDGSLVASTTLLQGLEKGATVTVKGLARTHPLLQTTIIKAFELTVNGQTYTWPPLLWAQQS